MGNPKGERTEHDTTGSSMAYIAQISSWTPQLPRRWYARMVNNRNEIRQLGDPSNTEAGRVLETAAVVTISLPPMVIFTTASGYDVVSPCAHRIVLPPPEFCLY